MTAALSAWRRIGIIGSSAAARRHRRRLGSARHRVAGGSSLVGLSARASALVVKLGAAAKARRRRASSGVWRRRRRGSSAAASGLLGGGIGVNSRSRRSLAAASHHQWRQHIWPTLSAAALMRQCHHPRRSAHRLENKHRLFGWRLISLFGARHRRPRVSRRLGGLGAWPHVGGAAAEMSRRHGVRQRNSASAGSAHHQRSLA